ncbi:hypothetical protein VE02_08666 [Pseudogymnoascus sp. 03VT05]|nr:hypothetical protein VE02_08666 [Pseudogymnoascus sp. 03VT05]
MACYILVTATIDALELTEVFVNTIFKDYIHECVLGELYVLPIERQNQTLEQYLRCYCDYS